MVKNYSTMPNSSGKSGQPYIVPELRGKEFTVSLNDTSCRFFLVAPLYETKEVPPLFSVYGRGLV